MNPIGQIVRLVFRDNNAEMISPTGSFVSLTSVLEDIPEGK